MHFSYPEAPSSGRCFQEQAGGIYSHSKLLRKSRPFLSFSLLLFLLDDSWPEHVFQSATGTFPLSLSPENPLLFLLCDRLSLAIKIVMAFYVFISLPISAEIYGLPALLFFLNI